MLNPLRLVQMWFSRRRNDVKTLIYYSKVFESLLYNHPYLL